jgi:hypothetical protein
VLENEEKNTVLHPKIPTCSGPDNHNEQTPALKVPLQTELRFHPRGYEQPPHRRACGTTDSGRLASNLHSSSHGPRTDAATGRLSFMSPLKGREPDIKAKEPAVGPRVALTVSSAEKPTSPAATTSAPMAASTCPPTPHRRAPAAPKRSSRSSLPSSPRKREWSEDDAPVFCSSNGSRTHNGCPTNHSSRRINSAAGQTTPLAGKAGDASPPP